MQEMRNKLQLLRRPAVPAWAGARDPRAGTPVSREFCGDANVHGQAGSSLLVLACWLASAWPLLWWVGKRMFDGSDEPLGILALVVAAVFLGSARKELRPRGRGLAWGAALLFASAWSPLPNLAQGTLAVAALACAFGLPRRFPGAFVLLLLALPWMSSLDFFFGPPVREFIAHGAAMVLRSAGLAVDSCGAVLSVGGRLVTVDPPCSGLGMLWQALFLAAALSAWFRLRVGKTITLLACAAALAVGANILRAATLFFPESGIVTWPHWTHQTVGLAWFGVALAPIWFLAHRWAGRAAAVPMDPAATAPLTRPIGIWCASALGAVALHICPLGSAPDSGSLDFLPWPTEWNGQPVTALSPDALEARFAADFPGQIRRSALPDGQVILRRVTRATRKLHPTADCLRASGFRLVGMMNETVGTDGGPVLAYRMTAPDGRIWEIEESVRGLRDSFRAASASDWFWHALAHPESGPWEAVTVMRSQR